MRMQHLGKNNPRWIKRSVLLTSRERRKEREKREEKEKMKVENWKKSQIGKRGGKKEE